MQNEVEIAIIYTFCTCSYEKQIYQKYRMKIFKFKMICRDLFATVDISHFHFIRFPFFSTYDDVTKTLCRFKHFPTFFSTFILVVCVEINIQKKTKTGTKTVQLWHISLSKKLYAGLTWIGITENKMIMQ